MMLRRVPVLGGVIRRMDGRILRLLHPHVFKGRVNTYGWPVVVIAEGSTAAIGDGVTLVSDTWFSEPGVSHACVLRTLNPGARLEIGENVGMSGTSVCVADSVRIGNECLIGADVLITDTDFHPIAAGGRRWARESIGTAPVRIEDNVFIGARAMVLKGAHIGEGSVIGAGSVVLGHIPAWSIAAGVPARVVGRVPDVPVDA